MTKKVLRGFLFLFFILPTPANASEGVQMNEPLQIILQSFAARAPSNSHDLIFKAIGTSPQLVKQLNSLAQSGTLKKMEISDTLINGLFGANFKGDTMTFVPSFIDVVAGTPPWDVRSSDSIAPNNLTFVIGHLASHAANPRPSRANTSVANFTKTMIKAEAVADLDAWNDVIDAAEKENSGKQLNNGQIVYILMSLRYRAPFRTGLKQTNKLEFMPSGKFELNSTNIDALNAALDKTSIFDFE